MHRIHTDTTLSCWETISIGPTVSEASFACCFSLQVKVVHCFVVYRFKRYAEGIVPLKSMLNNMMFGLIFQTGCKVMLENADRQPLVLYGVRGAICLPSVFSFSCFLAFYMFHIVFSILTCVVYMVRSYFGAAEGLGHTHE